MASEAEAGEDRGASRVPLVMRDLDKSLELPRPSALDFPSAAEPLEQLQDAGPSNLFREVDGDLYDLHSGEKIVFSAGQTAADHEEHNEAEFLRQAHEHGIFNMSDLGSAILKGLHPYDLFDLEDEAEDATRAHVAGQQFGEQVLVYYFCTAHNKTRRL